MVEVIKFDDYIVKYNDTPEIRDRVFDEIIKWYKKHDLFNGEEIMQSDDGLSDGPELLSDIADNILEFEYCDMEEI